MINELKPVSISDKLVGSGTNLQDASVDVLNANIVLITLRIEEIPNLFFHIIVHISLAHRGHASSNRQLAHLVHEVSELIHVKHAVLILIRANERLLHLCDTLSHHALIYGGRFFVCAHFRLLISA